MRRWAMAAATVLATGATWIGAAPALAGGGGCHGDATQGKGDTVEMVDACFTPSILFVQPGDSVRWINADPMIHNVGGSGWGYFEDLNQGDGFTATFDEVGTYPYACSYHPGMTGAVVVGDGAGAGNGSLVSVGTLAAPDEEPTAPASAATGTVATGTVATSSDTGSTGWIAAGGIGLLLGALIGTAVAGGMRSRDRSERAAPGASARG